jgi:hypothetical protein
MALLLQLQRAPAPNPGLEAGRAVLRAICNQQGGYYTPDNQCIHQPSSFSPMTPSWRCNTFGNTTTCNPY